MKKRNMICLIALILIAFFYMGCGSNQQNNNEKNIGVDKDNPLLQYFVSNHSDNEVILWGYEDVNNDGIKDLVVIYNISKDKNGMKIVVDNNGEYTCSNEVPAPIENQTIKFKNIDDKEEIEVIVSGSKNGNVGYAIFRLVDMEIVNLFGQDMEDCC